MAHVQAPSRWRDENQGVQATRAKGGNENAFSTPFAPSGKQAAGGPGKQREGGLATARRALGNITNHHGARQPLGGGAGAAKAGLSVRRALGEITNATPGKALQPAEKQQPAAKTQLQQQPAEPEHLAAAADPLTQRAEALAREGVERRAGMGWAELQAAAAERQQAQIAARMAAVAAAPSALAYGLLPVKQLSAEELLQPQEEGVAPMDEPAAALPGWGGAACASPSAPALEDVLPDFQLADFDAPEPDWAGPEPPEFDLCADFGADFGAGFGGGLSGGGGAGGSGGTAGLEPAMAALSLAPGSSVDDGPPAMPSLAPAGAAASPPGPSTAAAAQSVVSGGVEAGAVGTPVAAGAFRGLEDDDVVRYAYESSEDAGSSRGNSPAQ